MATSATTLIQRTRRFVRDWPQYDRLQASVSDTLASVTVPDATVYAANWHIEVDTEAMNVMSGSGSTLTVQRGVMGTTGASHAANTSVLVRPKFLTVEILDALNAALGASFPLIYRHVVDESLTIADQVYEYEIPDMPGISNYTLPYISEVYLQDGADPAFRRTNAFRIVRDETTPLIKFRRMEPPGCVVRIVGFGPYPPLGLSDSLGNQFPPHAEDLLVWYAGNYLLASGEAGRVAIDTGASGVDNRENANRTGSSMSASNALYQRFQVRLREAALPPMPRHVISVI